MPKKLRPAVDLMAFKCRTLKVKTNLLVKKVSLLNAIIYTATLHLNALVHLESYISTHQNLYKLG
jgi:ribonuclease PH